MQLTLVLELIFFGFAGICAIIFLIQAFKKGDGIDYDKWIQMYREQKQEALDKLGIGQKKINKIEDEIRKYKKILGMPIFPKRKN